MAIKREWDSSKPGVHPAFSPVTPEEIKAAELAMAAVQMAATPGRAQMSEKEKRFARATEQAELLKIDIDLWIEQKDKEKENYYRHAIIRELITCGRFAEALHYATGPKGGPLAGFSETVKEIHALQAALDMEDNEECDCPREETTAEDDKTVIHLDRHYISREFYSIKHGQWVSAWRCRHCEHTNAHPGIPERQQRNAELRHIAEKIDHTHSLYHTLSDRALLKAK